ncbi:hypothetical protein [Rhodopila sp.]|uniref:hypothetical protein n=1 Tax=Rhodopila sp. TaxID=2480087 RepID=UPI003D0A8D48
MKLLRFVFMLSLLLCATSTLADAGSADDYPTDARAEYVFACMASNGQTQQALRQCSCSIDVIASILPYDKYEQAETVLRMRRTAGGYLGEMFRAATASNMVRDLQEAEAEGEVRCF